jgi:hypothetical protein
MFEDGEVEEVVLALDVGGFLLLLLVRDLALEQVAGLLLTLPENVGLDLLGLLLVALQLVDVALPTLLLGGDVQVAFYLHVGEDLAGAVVVGDGEFPEVHVPLPGEEEVVGREHFEFVLDELLHPLDLVQLALQLDMVAHQQAHLVLCYRLQHLQCTLHYFIQHLFDLAAFAVDIFELGLSHSHQRDQIFLLLIE